MDVRNEPPAEPEETPDWESPVEQMQSMIAKMNQPVENEHVPQFLYIARLGDEDLATLSAEAFRNACLKAGQLARAANMKLGQLTSIHGGVGGPTTVPRP